MPAAALPTGIGPLGAHQSQQPGQAGEIGPLMPTGTPYPSSSAVSGRGQQCLVTTRSIPATPTMAGVPIPRPPHCRQARIGAGPWFVSSPFYSVPTETPGEGAASGRESRHSGGGGTARYGTVRHGTGSLRVAQSTADTHTVTMFRGSAPGIALTAGKGAQPRSALGLCTPPSPRPVQQIATPGAGGPARRGAARPRSWQARRQGGGCARAATLAPAGVSVPRAVDTLYKYLQREERRGRRPAGGTPGLCACHGRGGAAAERGAGALLPPCHSRRPAPSLGHRPAELPARGSATKRGLPAAAGSSITSA